MHAKEVPAETLITRVIEERDLSIKVDPPILGTEADPNPQYVDLSFKVELFHGRGEDYGALSEADRVQYNFWDVVHSLGDQLHNMAECHEVEHWPDDAFPKHPPSR